MMPQEQENSQEPMENPDETAAVLSFATMLRGNLLKGQQEQPQTQEMGSESVPEEKSEIIPEKEEKAPDLEANNREMESRMDTKLDELRKEIKEVVKEEISNLKESIESALSED